MLPRKWAKLYGFWVKRPECPSEDCRGKSVKDGYYKTKWNAQPVPRYRCTVCGRRFSSHTHRKTFGQHRPDLNEMVYDLYASGMTLRRIAIVLGVNRKTIVRKFKFLAKIARLIIDEKLTRSLLRSLRVHFDEMETFEH